jgi:hypothetical protein
MKYSTYIWRTDFFSGYKKAIQENSLKVLLEIILLFMTFIFIPICILFLVITIPTDISRISIAIALRVKRKYSSKKWITHHCSFQ